MMFILDTNVVSELRKVGDGRADVNVAAWAAALPAQSLYLSAITLLELEMGVLAMERKDDAQGRLLRKWLDGHVVPFFSGRILPVDEEVAIRCAKLHVPDRKSYRDSLITATALVVGMTIATRDEKDFRASGAKLVNPWNLSGG